MFKCINLDAILKRDRKCNKITRKVFGLPVSVAVSCAGWE